jgi:ribosomal protein L24E
VTAVTSPGRWQPIEKQVWDTIITPCDCCGQVVATRLWVVEVDGQDQRFCGESCEELYRSHVVPRRRARGAP